jgi:hypothetical protein
MNFVSQAIALAVRDLLETKHLYQNVEISVKAFDDFIRNSTEECRKEAAKAEPGISSPGPAFIAKIHDEQLRDRLNSILNSAWDFDAETFASAGRGARPARISENFPSITAPSARVCCGSKKCKGTAQPHNSGYIGAHPEINSYILSRHPSIVQVYSFAYQCQNCKEEPLIFLIKRDGVKLTLVGRSQFPEVLVPGYIPEAQRKFYKKAIVADQTSFTLAAALYLRTVIEQFFYAIIPEAEIKIIKGNPTGDELADLYAKTLPQNFPSNFPSLKKAYSDLSEILHSGKEDDETKKAFLTFRNAVDGHFKAVQLFKEMPA